jgi:hypothetical protein
MKHDASILRCYGECLPGGLDACCIEEAGGFATAINSLEALKHLSYDVQENRERRHPMKHNRKTALVVILAAGLIAFGAMPAVAQDKPANNMQILLEKIRADKKLLVAANVELTESEAKVFWPLYEEYQNELFLLRKRTGKLINDYAKAFKDMSDEKAKRLLDESINIESLGLKLRKAYLPKFRQILPEKKAARYFQIENKVQAALYQELAAQIPLVQ